MGIKFTTKLTKKGSLEFDELVQELMELKPGEKVSVTISEQNVYQNEEEELCIPRIMIEEAGIDDCNGLVSYVRDNSIVIIGANNYLEMRKNAHE